jgi:tetratricopeptide (TPR) repeat protein
LATPQQEDTLSKAISITALFLCAFIFGGTAAWAEASHLDEGIAQYRAENFEEAQALFEKARAEQPDSSVAAFYLGMARKQGGDLTGAIKNLTDSVTLKPPVLDAYLELADVCHVQGDDAQALKWVQRSEEAGVKPARSEFLKGLILSAQGKSAGALKAFRQAKHLDPSLTQTADFQIAIVMAASRQLPSARDALKAVIAADPNSEIASYAKEYEQSFTRIIENYRTWHLTVGLNYLYDDNAISNPSNAAAKAAIGNPTGQRDHAFLGNFRVDYTPMISGDFLFSAQYLLQNTQYGNTDTANENPSTIVNSLTLIPGYAFGSSAFSMPINYTHVLLKEEKYQQLISTRPTWSDQINEHNIVQAALTYTRREMLTPALSPDENRDGDIYGVSLGHIFTYGKEGGMAALRYEFNFDKAEGVNWENRGHKLSLNGVIPVCKNVKVNLSGEVTFQDYFNTHTTFLVKRNDTTWFGSTGISWNLTDNVMLSAQYAHTTVDSNLELFAYSRNTFSTGIEVGF